MKPTRSRVMCPDCGRQKMLFETEKKAENFLKFNGDAVNPDGTREMRVYYCPSCCGYHISSHKFSGKSRTEDMISRYRKEDRGGILETIELYTKLTGQKFTSRKELRKWVKQNATEYTEASKNRAIMKYYRENPKLV